jgi:hypothetical protein
MVTLAGQIDCGYNCPDKADFERRPWILDEPEN